MFVGVGRRAEVDSLLADLDRVTATREPTPVALAAGLGAGKARIIQEFYRALAAHQLAPGYWPASLLTESSDDGLGLSELTASRKTVRYRGSFVPPEGVQLPWLWLAPATGRLSYGSPAPAFEGPVSQLIPHVPALMRRLAAGGALEPARQQDMTFIAVVAS